MTWGAVGDHEKEKKQAPSPFHLSHSPFLAKSNSPTKRFRPATSTSDMGKALNTVEFSLTLKLVAVRGNRREETELAGCFSWIWLLHQSSGKSAASRAEALACNKNCWQADQWYLLIKLKKLCKSFFLCLYQLGTIVCDLPASFQAKQLPDLPFTVGAVVVVSSLPSCVGLGLGVTVGWFFKMASLSVGFGSWGLSEDRETKEKEEEEDQIVTIIWLTGINSCNPSARTVLAAVTLWLPKHKKLLHLYLSSYFWWIQCMKIQNKCGEVNRQ